MVKHIQIKKLDHINDELSTISKQCEEIYNAWRKDPNNSKLFFEYRDILIKRKELINRYRSTLVIR